MKLPFFLFFALFAASADAQDMADLVSPRFDVLMIEDGHVDGTAVITYGNDVSMGSDGGWFTLESDNGITVRVFIEVNAVDGFERITVTTGPEHIAYPVEADVADGDEVVITVGPPLM